MTKDELKKTLSPQWFEDPTEVILDSLDEYFKDVTENGVEPSENYFTSLVNANVEEYYTCSAQSNYWY